MLRWKLERGEGGFNPENVKEEEPFTRVKQNQIPPSLQRTYQHQIIWCPIMCLKMVYVRPEPPLL